MENKLTLTAPDLQLGGTYRRHSSSSVSPTPPRSPTFLIHKPPSSPGGLSNCSSNGPDRNSLSPNVGRFFTLSSPTTKKVCTMDCAHCKHMAKNLRAASPIFNDSASAPCSRKSSVVVGKWEIYLGTFSINMKDFSKRYYYVFIIHWSTIIIHNQDQYNTTFLAMDPKSRMSAKWCYRSLPLCIIDFIWQEWNFFYFTFTFGATNLSSTSKKVGSYRNCQKLPW